MLFLCQASACVNMGWLIYLFGVLRRSRYCTGHITTGSWKDRGNQYIQFVRVLYCKLPTNSKQLPTFPLEAVPGIEPQPQRWEARVLPLCHRGPLNMGWRVSSNFLTRSAKKGSQRADLHLEVYPKIQKVFVSRMWPGTSLNYKLFSFSHALLA